MLESKKNIPEVVLPNFKHLQKQSQMQNVMEREGDKQRMTIMYPVAHSQTQKQPFNYVPREVSKNT